MRNFFISILVSGLMLTNLVVYTDWFDFFFEEAPLVQEKTVPELPASDALDPYDRNDTFADRFGANMPNYDTYKFLGPRYSYGGYFWFLLHGEPTALGTLYGTTDLLKLEELIFPPPSREHQKQMLQDLGEFWYKWRNEICGTDWAYDQALIFNEREWKQGFSPSGRVLAAVKHNSGEGWYRLGLYALEGGEYYACLDGKKLSKKDGISAMHRAVELGQRKAGGMLGHFYIRGLHVQQDIKKAVGVLTVATFTNGDAVAAFNLATLYDRGLGVNQDSVKALALYQLAGKLAPEEGLSSTAALLAPEMTEAQRVEANRFCDSMFQEISAKLGKKEEDMKARLATALPQIKQEIDEQFPWVKMTLVPYSVREREAAARQK